jgi:hypothetical protein
MNVIVFASRKGGTGKSTLAAHLAAQVHKATKPCLLIDADPQGSLTLWHKLRGTNEPTIKTAVNSVSGIIAAAKRDGIEWVFIDTPPNMSAVVEDAIKNATMVVIPARPGVFDVNAVQETMQALCCRDQRRAGPPGRSREPDRYHRARSARQVPGAGMGRPDYQPRRSLDGAQPWRRRAGILCRRPRGGGNQPALGCDRTLGEGDPRYGVGERSDAQASGISSRRLRGRQRTRGHRAFFCCCATFPFLGWMKNARFMQPSACRKRPPATGTGSPTRCLAPKERPRC